MPPLSQRSFDDMHARLQKLELLLRSVPAGIVSGATPPANPRPWQLWYTYSTPALKIWDGKVWIAV